MKKLMVSYLVSLFALQANSQSQFPFSEYLSKTHSELRNEGFKYNRKFNRYSKRESSLIRDNLILGIFGVSTDMPGYGDFYMTVQFGDQGPAWLSVGFHNDEQYARFVRYLAENDIDYTEVDINYGSIITYTIGGIDFTLKKEMMVANTFYSDRTTARGLFNTYTYYVNTGIPPSSSWHERQVKKVKGGEPLRMSPEEFAKFPEITYEAVENGSWSATYNIGTVDPMTIHESVSVLSDRELRYRRINESTGAAIDFIMEYSIEGNRLRAVYKQHTSGATGEEQDFRFDAYLRPATVMWLAKNGDYSDIKKLLRESDKQ